MKRPKPLIAVTKTNWERKKRASEPLKGTSKRIVPSTRRKVPSIIPTKMPGIVLPMSISRVVSGETSS